MAIATSTALIGAAIAGAGASAYSASQQSKAAGKAAKASGSAAAQQTELQREIYRQQRADQEPWRRAGGSALNALQYGMGLAPTYTRGQPLNAEQLRQQLLPQYTITTPAAPSITPVGQDVGGIPGGGPLARVFNRFAPQATQGAQPGEAGATIIDERALQAEINRRLAAQNADAQTLDLNRATGLTRGDLLRDFSMADYQADPGYAFRQRQGMQAIQRGAAARGGLLSGSALKGIQRFGQDLASQEYGNAYNRFQSNQANQYNRLASLAGVGQTANNALQQAGSNFANAATQISQANAANQGNAMLAAGQARASGYAGIGNALSGAIQNWPQQQHQQGYQIPQGYQMGSGYLGNAEAIKQGYQPLDYGAANAGYYDA